jgi:hypothetical protein
MAAQLKYPEPVVKALKAAGMQAAEVLWDCHGTWVIKHSAIEQLAAFNRIQIESIDVIRAERDECVVLVTGVISGSGELGVDRRVKSFGEANCELNYKTSQKMAAYPYAMAEKRGVDRVVLKLLALHGYVYSQEEADEFRSQPAETPSKPEVETDDPRGWEEDEEGPRPNVAPRRNNDGTPSKTKIREACRYLIATLKSIKTQAELVQLIAEQTPAIDDVRAHLEPNWWDSADGEYNGLKWDIERARFRVAETSESGNELRDQWRQDFAGQWGQLVEHARQVAHECGVVDARNMMPADLLTGETANQLREWEQATTASEGFPK